MPEKQVVIAPGMDESLDARHLPEGVPRLLQNTRVRQGARFEHRPGQSNPGVSGLPASATAGWLTEHRGVRVAGVERVSDTTQASRRRHIYIQDSNDSWHLLARHGVVVPERRVGVMTVTDRGSLPDGHSTVAIDDLIFIAYEDDANSQSKVLAVAPSGTVLRQVTLSVTRPHLLYVNGQLLLVAQVGATTTLRAHILIPGTLATSTTANVGTLTAAASDWDVCPVGGGTTWMLAFPDSATSILVHRMSGLTSAANGTFATTAEAQLIGIAADNTNNSYCVGYLDGTTIEQFFGNATTLAGTNNTVRAATGSEVYRAQVGVAYLNSSYALVTGGFDAITGPTFNSRFLVHTQVDSSGNLFTPLKVYNMRPASKPFTYGSGSEKQVLIVAHNQNDTSLWIDQACHFILELERTGSTGGGANLCAISYEHIASGRNSSAEKQLPEVADLGNGRRCAMVMWEDPNGFAGVDMMLFRASLGSESMEWAGRQVLSQDALYVSGGCLYDIAGPVARLGTGTETTHYGAENNFPYAPEIALQIASGGNLTAGTEYSFKAVYRALDSSGRVHRSAPSEAVTATPTGVHLKITGRAAACAATGRTGAVVDPPVADFYRAHDGGAYYFSDSSSTVSVDALTAAFTDTNSDTTVEANHVLYTDLGVLPTMPPSGARLLCQSGNRMFVVGWRPNVVQFSKLYVPTAPWEFCDDDAFRIFVPTDITALGWMDGALAIFSERRVYLVTGDGPNDQGVGVYSEPRELPASVGADSPHVVEIPAGLMYKGSGTIWLLPRGFGPPIDIGVKIQRTLEAYPYLRAAVRCANDNYDLTHFLLAAGDLPASATLVAVWDNKLQAWSRDQLSCNIGAAGSVDGVFQALLATWTALGQVPVRKLSGSVSDLDDSGSETWPEMRIGFGDIRPYGPLGWGRLERLQIHGEVVGKCDLNLVTVTDGVSGMNAVGHTMLATKHMTGVGQFYAEHAVDYPPGGAYRFDIYDSVPTTSTSGIVLHSIAYKAGESLGLRKLSESERF